MTATMAEFRCVRCLADVDFRLEGDYVTCPKCGERFPLVKGEIPVFLEDSLAASNAYGSAFREGAQAYDSTWNIDPAHGRWVMDRLLALEPGILELANQPLLEIGAGTGHLTRTLAAGSHLPYSKLWVTDLSAEMLSVNWQHRAPEERDRPVRYMVCNVLRIPLPDAKLGGVFGFDILHHVLNYTQGLAEIARVLRPGGVCVLKEPHRGAYLFLSFLSRALLRAGSANWLIGPLSRRDRARLDGWQAHALRLMELHDRGEHEALRQIDDKYFFDPKRLAAEARQLGFRRFSEANVLFREAERIPYTPMFLDHFRGLGLSPRALDLVAELGADVDATIGQFLLEHAPINTLFLFWK